MQQSSHIEMNEKKSHGPTVKVDRHEKSPSSNEQNNTICVQRNRDDSSQHSAKKSPFVSTYLTSYPKIHQIYHFFPRPLLLIPSSPVSSFHFSKSLRVTTGDGDKGRGEPMFSKREKGTWGGASERESDDLKVVRQELDISRRA